MSSFYTDEDGNVVYFDPTTGEDIDTSGGTGATYNPADRYANTPYDPSQGTGQGTSFTYDPVTGERDYYQASSVGSGFYNPSAFSGDGGGSSGIASTLSKFLGNLKKEDIAKMLAAGWTIKDILAGRKARQASVVPAGKWTTPMLTATRSQIAQAPSAPGQAAMGQQRFTPTTYAPKAAQGGIMGLAAGGLRDGAFVIPADVVSHFGNGSSEAGLEFLANKLGATPIKGKGDGMSDSIDTTIEGQQPAKVANEEAIVSPEKVAALGKGDPKKGAKVLYAMMDRVRQARTGTKKQGKQIKPDKYAPGGIAGYANGGAVAFVEGGATTPVAGTPINTNMAAWATPYVEDYVSKGFAQANKPYEAYTGTIAAGQSDLQKKAFTGYDNYATPTGIGTAGTEIGKIATKMGDLGYTGTTFGSQYSAPPQYQTSQFGTQFQAPTAFQANQFTNQFQDPGAYQASQFANQYTGTGAYTPTTATSGFNAPGAYQGVDFTTGIAPQAYQAGQFANQFQGPEAYRERQYATGLGGVKSVEEYMTPYLQGVTGIEAREARRQSEIDRIAAASRLAQAGGYGGSRQAIMEAEGARNLQTQIGDIQAKGLQSAYDRAQAQRLAESQASMEAQRAGEASRQFGAQQGMTAAQLAAQYGTTAQQMGEESRQFGATQGMQGLQMLLDARKAAEASRQFGAGQAMTGAQTAAQYGLQAQQQTAQERQFAAQRKAEAEQLSAQYGLSAQQAAEASKQFGAQQKLSAAQTSAQYGSEAARAAEASKQFQAQQALATEQAKAQYGLAAQQEAERSKQYGYGQQMSAAEQAAQYGLASQRETEASKQFGARYGLDALSAQAGAQKDVGNLAALESQVGLAGLSAQLSAGATQRDIEKEKVAADMAQFNEQRAYDLKMQQYKQSLLTGLPIEQGPAAPAPTLSTEMIQGLAGLAKSYPELKKYFEGMYGDIFGAT